MNWEITADRLEARDTPAPERARRRQDAVGHFARKVSHDLNNFATVIRTYGELLLAELPTDSRAHADVQEMHRASEAMVEYLERVARFGKSGAGKARMVDVDTVVRDAVCALDDEQADHSSIPIRVVGESGARAFVDSHWFGDVIQELLRNAREASAPGQTVTVTTSLCFDGSRASCADLSLADVPPMLLITVADDGPGFADVVSANAEDPFVSTKGDERGAGFGLALASAFARQFRGQLERARVDGRTYVSLGLPSA